MLAPESMTDGKIDSVTTYGPGGVCQTKLTFPIKAGERFGVKADSEGRITHGIAVPSGEPDPKADDPRWVAVAGEPARRPRT